MTARVVISCDGTWPGDMACRGALPTREVDFPMARHAAREQGWRWYQPHGDLCPAHVAQVLR